MELLILSDLGSEKTTKSNNPSESEITSTMDSLDWNSFHQVCLTKGANDWIEVGGSLNKTIGLSVIYEMNGEQFVIDQAPYSIEQLTEILLSYFRNDGEFKRKYPFTGENGDSENYDRDEVYRQMFEAQRIEQNESFKKNRNEKYEPMEMVELYLFAPYYFVKGTTRYESFLELTNEKFDLKLTQKIILYALSFLSWYLLLKYL